MSGYIIYHPRRSVSVFDHVTVYHDWNGANQDPYVWNSKFLHTYCHMAQMSPEVGQINFWVSGDTFPRFSHLYCDLVFVVAEKQYWEDANMITADHSLVDSQEAYRDHYQWAKYQHHFKRRRRFTLKANPELSFQPQDWEGHLLDLVPVLNEHGVETAALQHGLRSGFTSKPMRIDDRLTTVLYEWLSQAAIKHQGEMLQYLRKQNPHLASPQRD